MCTKRGRERESMYVARIKRKENMLEASEREREREGGRERGKREKEKERGTGYSTICLFKKRSRL